MARVCVCMCVCVRARARARVRAYVRGVRAFVRASEFGRALANVWDVHAIHRRVQPKLVLVTQPPWFAAPAQESLHILKRQTWLGPNVRGRCCDAGEACGTRQGRRVGHRCCERRCRAQSCAAG